MTRTTSIAIALAATASLGLATPAQAALPAISLFVADGTNQLSSIDASTGVATPLGDIGFHAIGGGLNPVDSKVYLVADNCDVYSVDVTTPSASQVGTFSSLTHGPNPVNYCDSATIDGKGVLWASAEASGDDLLATYDTATNTPVLMPGTQPDYFDSLWFDPSDGTLRGQGDTSGNVFTLDLTSGVATDTGVTMSPYSYSVVLDNAGNYYASDWDTLFAGTTSDYSTSNYVGDFGGTASSGGVQALFTTTNFWPAPATPELPNTGQSVVTLTIFGVVGALLVAGGVLLVLRRNRARSDS